MKNPQLRKMYHEKMCIICKITHATPCHIRSYGATRVDDDLNLMPLCNTHHQLQHSMGILSFIKKYPVVFCYITDLGWQIINGKLINEELNRKYGLK